MAEPRQQWDIRSGRKLKLRDLHILSVVVHAGSMAKAASQLAMSQPAVSESIANLERALGVRILDRNARGIESTIYAQALLQRCRIIFDELAQSVSDIEFLANPSRGEVRVATGDTAATGFLAPAIDSLSSEFPDIVTRISQASAEPLAYPELRDREVDVVLARITKAFKHPELDAEVLFDDPGCVAVGTSSPWASRRKVELADLANEKWTLTSDKAIQELIVGAFRARGLEPPKERVTASSMLLRARLLATGRYVTVLPQSVLRWNASNWSLKRLPLDLGAKPMCMTLLTLKNRTISPVAKLFIERIRLAARAEIRPGSRS
jgi:DNA-binding transcriptional LysR family regulator